MKISVRFIAFFVLLLGLGACSKSGKSEPEPTYELMGRWHLDSTTDQDYDGAGKVTRETPTTFKPAVNVDVMATEFVSYDGGGNVTDRTPYTRSGKVLQMGTGTDPSAYSTIEKLTATELVLTNPRYGATGAYPGTTTLRFTRP